MSEQQLRLWRCLNPACAPDTDFAAAAGTCPKCGLTIGRGRAGHLIVPLVVVHYDPPSGIEGIGKNEPACQPGTPIYGLQATGAPDAVNCPACKATEAWQQAPKGAQVPSRYLVPGGSAVVG
jgi:hypothetical protein